VLAAIDMLKKRGIVDDANIAVTAWSYGGYMSSWLIGHAQFWKAAIAGAPVTNLLDQYVLSDSNVARIAAIGGSPYTDDWMRHWVEQSPITYFASMVTPTLILQDVGDYRVTITQGYQLYHALKDRGIATDSTPTPSEATARSIPCAFATCTAAGSSGSTGISRTADGTIAPVGWTHRRRVHPRNSLPRMHASCISIYPRRRQARQGHKPPPSSRNERPLAARCRRNSRRSSRRSSRRWQRLPIRRQPRQPRLDGKQPFARKVVQRQVPVAESPDQFAGQIVRRAAQIRGVQKMADDRHIEARDRFMIARLGAVHPADRDIEGADAFAQQRQRHVVRKTQCMPQAHPQMGRMSEILLRQSPVHERPHQTFDFRFARMRWFRHAFTILPPCPIPTTSGGTTCRGARSSSAPAPRSP
jgi:hypothetical protein